MELYREENSAKQEEIFFWARRVYKERGAVYRAEDLENEKLKKALPW